MRLVFVTQLAVLLIVIVILSGCRSTIDRHGFAEADIQMWSRVEYGNTAEEVQKLLGTPTFRSLPSITETWYYLSYYFKRSNYSLRNSEYSKMLRITFDKEGKVSDIKQIDGRSDIGKGSL